MVAIKAMTNPTAMNFPCVRIQSLLPGGTAGRCFARCSARARGVIAGGSLATGAAGAVGAGRGPASGAGSLDELGGVAAFDFSSALGWAAAGRLAVTSGAGVLIGSAFPSTLGFSTAAAG